MTINKIDTHILPSKFAYHAPENLVEALGLLSEYKGDAKVLAGGTDLLVQMKQKMVEPLHIINIKGVSELRGISKVENGIFIGSCTRLRDAERSPIISEKVPLLKETIEKMASVQIRNMATVGGNLCNASPAADTATPLIVLGAENRITGPSGERKLPIERFFLGPGITALNDDELLMGVFIPNSDEDSGASFLKIGRTSLDVATINVAVSLRLQRKTIADSKIAIGAVAPTPLKLSTVENWMKGKKTSSETFQEAAKRCCDKIKPISDVRASASYRMTVTEYLVQDALTIACERAEGGRIGD